MKVLILSNGNPLNVAGGYNKQLRYIFRIFNELGYNVFFLNTGMIQDNTNTSYRLPLLNKNMVQI